MFVCDCLQLLTRCIVCVHKIVVALICIFIACIIYIVQVFFTHIVITRFEQAVSTCAIET